MTDLLISHLFIEFDAQNISCPYDDGMECSWSEIYNVTDHHLYLDVIHQRTTQLLQYLK